MKSRVSLALLMVVLSIFVYNPQTLISDDPDGTCSIDGTCNDSQSDTSVESKINEIEHDRKRKFQRKVNTKQDNIMDDPKLNDMSTHERVAYLKQQEKEKENDEDKPKNPRELQVLFQNKSGKKVKLFWKGPNENIVQGELDSPAEIVVNTFIGHEFFFASYDNEKEKLYSMIMAKHVELYTLLTPKEMKKRDAEFEEKRKEFFANYYKETGRTWQNYWPRDPVTSFMYNVTYTGQKFQVSTEYSNYKICPSYFMDDPLFIHLLNDLSIKESEYKIEFDKNETSRLIEQNDKLLKEREERRKIKEKMEETGEKIDSKYFDKDGNEIAVGEDRDWFHRIPVYKSFWDNYTDIITNNIYQIMRYNGSVYCYNYNETKSLELIVQCTAPRLFRIFNFLTDEECKHIIEVGSYLGLKRSTVSEAALKSLDRTSQTVWVERKFSPIVDHVIKRIANSIHVDHTKLFLNASAESLQLVHYFDGELYKPHWDYGTDSPNNRFITFLMYLNEVKEGGNTSFPNADKSCKGENNYFGVHPEKGSVAWFYDLFPDGNVDDSTLHYAEPPAEGSEKWMTNLWIWDPFFK